MKELNFINILNLNADIQEKVRLWRNKEDIKKYMVNQHIITKEEHFKWLENLKHRNDQKSWVVFFNNIPIGTFSLQNIDYKKLTLESGFYIGADDYRGSGIGAIIVYIMLEYFFNILKFRALNGVVLEKNTSVIRMHKKFGFKIKKKKSAFKKNKDKEIFLKIKKTEWNALRKNIFRKMNIKGNIIVSIDNIKYKIFPVGS